MWYISDHDKLQTDCGNAQAQLNHAESHVIRSFNRFIPGFLKLTLPSLNSDMSTDAKRGFSLKQMAKSVDPDETALYEKIKNRIQYSKQF